MLIFHERHFCHVCSVIFLNALKMKSSLLPHKSKCRVQQVFGDKLKIEEKLQVLDALLSVSDQRTDIAVVRPMQTNNSSIKYCQRTDPQEQSLYSCDICKKSFDSRCQYQGHLASHRSGNFPWTCTQCSEGTSTFTSQADLQAHEKLTHLTFKSYQCKYCGNLFSHSSLRDSHQYKVHSEHSRFACQFCDKRFYKKSDLRGHLATHLALRGSVCEVCGRSFSHVSNLIRHSYLHSGVKPYPCNTCGRRFTQLTSLKQHKIRNHENLSVTCPALPVECGRVFRTPLLAREHAFRVHPKVPWEKSIPISSKVRQTRRFYCRNCGETFQLAKDLKIHNLEHQKQDNSSEQDDGNKSNIMSLKLNSEAEELRQKNLDNSPLEGDTKNVESTHDEFLASLPKNGCLGVSFDPMGMCSDALSDSLQFLVESQSSSLESNQRQKSDNYKSKIYPVGLEALAVEDLGLEQQSDEVSSSQEERDEKESPPALLQCTSVNRVHKGSIESEKFHCMNVGSCDPCNEGMELENLKVNVNVCDLIALPCIDSNCDQTHISPLKGSDQVLSESQIQNLSRQFSHAKYSYADNNRSIEIPELGSLNVYNDNNNCEELTRLNPRDEISDTYVLSLGDSQVGEDTCATLLEVLEQQDQCLTEGTCSTLLEQLEFQNHCLDVSERTSSSLLVALGRDKNTVQTSGSIGGAVEMDTVVERTTQLNFDATDIRGSNTPEAEDCVSGLCDKSENAVKSGDYIFSSMEFSDEIIPLLPETNVGSEEIVIYVSQGDGVPAELHIQPVMTTVVMDGSSLTTVPAGKESQDVLQSLSSMKMKKTNRTKKKCSECGKVFFKLSNLKQHLGTHYPNMRKYECDLCHKSFAWKSTLNKHMLTTHAIILKQCLCDLCGRRFDTITQVKEHKMRDHQSLRPNCCNICGKSFFRKYDLGVHQRIHTNKKPFMCGTCGKTFNHLSHVKRHESVHQGARSFDCDMCGSSFTQQSALKIHWENHPSCKL